MNTIDYNSSKSSNSNSKNEEAINIYLSPIDEEKGFSDAVWLNFSKKFKDNRLNGQKKGKSMDTPYKRWGHSSLYYKNSLIIFGGRHSTRSLVNIYAFDLENYFWYKLDPLGQTPAARDSHSSVIVKNDLICFGGSGSGKKLNDLWSFNLETKKWSKVSTTGLSPSPRDGQNYALIKNNYLMIYGGIDENDKNLNDIHLLNLGNNVWRQVETYGFAPESRDSQSCSFIYNKCYIFGGQGNDDILFNDLYTLTFEISEMQNSIKAFWEKENVEGNVPPPRTSHSSNIYKNNYLIIIGGEDGEKFPLNDVWIYNISQKTWNELKAKNNDLFEARFCHSATLIGEKIYVYGGMKNAETTLDNLCILSLNGKLDGLQEGTFIDNKIS